MRKLVLLALATCAVAPVLAAPDIGVSIGIHQPGVYGRIDIGNYPQPQLVYAEPVIVAPVPVVVERRPIYLYVPPVHQQNWRRYCARYAACGQPVYFVQDRWVRERWDQDQRERREHVDHRDEHRDDHRDDHRGNERRRGHDERGEHGDGRQNGR